jgi:endonuclease IV
MSNYDNVKLNLTAEQETNYRANLASLLWLNLRALKDDCKLMGVSGYSNLRSRHSTWFNTNLLNHQFNCVYMPESQRFNKVHCCIESLRAICLIAKNGEDQPIDPPDTNVWFQSYKSTTNLPFDATAITKAYDVKDVKTNTDATAVVAGGAEATDSKDKDDATKVIGLHVFTNGDISASIEAARATFPLDAIQIFTHGPRFYNKLNHDYVAVKAASAGITTIVHSSYVTDIWKGETRLTNLAIDQFKSCKDIGGCGVVLHLPKKEPAEIVAGVKLLADELDKRPDLINQKIILEMKAVKKHATKSYETPDKINNLIELLQAAGLTSDRVGICIDTAHIYASKADITTYAEATEYVNALKYVDWICLLHLNGNMIPNTKARDKHAVPLGEDDFIWKDVKYEDSGCRAFIEFVRAHNIKFIVEIKAHHTNAQINAFIDKL